MRRSSIGRESTGAPTVRKTWEKESERERKRVTIYSTIIESVVY